MPDPTDSPATPPTATESAALALLRERAGAHLVQAEEAGNTLSLTLRPDGLRQVCIALRDEPGLRFDYPADLAARDTGSEIVLWYRLWSTTRRRTVLIHLPLDREDPVAPSVCDIWPGLNWFEREAYDLFGVEFDGHPNSGDPTRMRILLPKTWEGFPFRKDYVPVFSGDPLQGPQEPN